ncbi:hypothetical protein ASE19_15230 [Nocardioides sp. Root79]|nr:hypothetical protein ASE19_15230 [Nocardioides sp. Root79]KRC69045.1 hypothetical protein ASE20_15885 [Nocardioides sp. Root240]
MTASSSSTGSRVRGGVHIVRRSVSGVSRFSSGRECSSAIFAIATLARSRRRAATGSLSAHARGAGGPSPCETRVGSSSSGISAASLTAASHSLA